MVDYKLFFWYLSFFSSQICTFLKHLEKLKHSVLPVFPRLFNFYRVERDSQNSVWLWNINFSITCVWLCVFIIKSWITCYSWNCSIWNCICVCLLWYCLSSYCLLATIILNAGKVLFGRLVLHFYEVCISAGDFITAFIGVNLNDMNRSPALFLGIWWGFYLLSVCVSQWICLLLSWLTAEE